MLHALNGFTRAPLSPNDHLSLAQGGSYTGNSASWGRVHEWAPRRGVCGVSPYLHVCVVWSNKKKKH